MHTLTFRDIAIKIVATMWLISILMAQMLIDRDEAVSYPDSVYIVEFYGGGKEALRADFSRLEKLDFVRRIFPYKPNAYMIIVEPGKVDTSRIKEVLRNEGLENYRIVH